MTLPFAQRRSFVDQHVPPGDTGGAELVAMIEAGDDSAFLAGAAGAGLLDTVRIASPDQPGQIGNYKILRVLGRGGMGVVYLALRNDDVFRKVVALKVIGDALQADGDHVERFKRERQILAGLDHPNIARILDGGNTEDGRPFYVMEYVAGSPIDDYCARMNTDVPTRLRMMAQACDALDYLHRNAIAHRDIKPQNILVTLDGRVKLVDFGIAKRDTAEGLLDSGTPGQPTLIMTPGYASPEQVAGDSAGTAGDIYSVAVVIYQLLTGKLPFTGRDGRPSLEAQLSGQAPTPPSREMAKTPKPATAPLDHARLSYPDLDRVVLTALERDPRQRYATVQLLAEDLRRCLDGRPIGARPATFTYTVGKLVGRNRMTAAVVALALLAGAIGTWLASSAYVDRVRLQAREEEFERFVAVLADRVSLWQQPAASVPADQRVAAIQSASQRMQSPELRDLAERAPNPARVKQAVGVLRQTLDRADAIARDQPDVRREIAVAFRRIGDFERTTPLPAIADKQIAAESYQRAAAIAGELRAADPSWAERELRELTILLAAIGGRVVPVAPAVAAAEALEAAPPAAPAAPPTAPPAPSPRPTSVAAATEAAAVDPELRAQVEQRLRSVSADAARARRNLESLQASLASQGQVVRSDVVAAIESADGLIEDARVSLDADDVTSAEDYLRRASAQLRRVFQAVGG
jgi:hypothetical protein